MLKGGFILLTVAIAIAVYRGASYAADLTFKQKSRRLRFKITTALILVLWPIYVGWISIGDFFLQMGFPPRVPMFLVLPCLIMTTFFFASGYYKNMIDVIPLSWVIYFQAFRIGMELLLFGLFMENVLPWAATFEGYNFDIGIGITAPIMGFLVAKGRLYKWAIVGWNILGILTLATVATIINTYAYRPWVFHETATILGKGFGRFPYTYFASCFLPSGLFMHIFSLVKVARQEKYSLPTMLK